MISEHGYLSVPRETFSQAGRQQFIALLREGLRPEFKVLEFGCGCLRIAYWLVRFLDAGGYHGFRDAGASVAAAGATGVFQDVLQGSGSTHSPICLSRIAAKVRASEALMLLPKRLH